MRMQQLRGPQLSVAGDKFPDGLGWKRGDPNSPQDFFDVLEIGGQAFRKRLLLLFGKTEFSHRFEMSFLQAPKLCEIRIVLTRGELYQLNQAIGHAAHRRDNHSHAFSIRSQERTQNAANRLITTRVGHAGAAEFVNDPLGNHLFASRTQ